MIFLTINFSIGRNNWNKLVSLKILYAIFNCIIANLACKFKKKILCEFANDIIKYTGRLLGRNKYVKLHNVTPFTSHNTTFIYHLTCLTLVKLCNVLAHYTPPPSIAIYNTVLSSVSMPPPLFEENTQVGSVIDLYRLYSLFICSNLYMMTICFLFHNVLIDFHVLYATDLLQILNCISVIIISCVIRIEYRNIY